MQTGQSIAEGPTSSGVSHYTTAVGEPDRATLVDIFTRATLIRLCGNRFASVIRSGRIAAPYYSPRGQEIVSAAMGVALNSDDYMITIYRGLHDHLAKGVPLRELWAEYAGRATGSCKGKGGPMHITHPASGVVVTTGIVGSGIPIANGLGWASLVREDGKVTVTSFGDGASNIGAFHEGLNLASLWKLPVIFLCQNNRYAEHTSYELGTASPTIAGRSTSYSMPGVRVNGNDPVEMWKACRVAIDRARAGEGPTLIEAMTFRFDGHVFGDSGDYIPKEEYAEALANDPVPAFRKSLLEGGLAAEEELAAIEADIEARITDAVEFALASPYPEDSELRLDVLLEEVEP
ncbi:thiamine pyrophosphate-dependent dehydrogenase E1 component subunit alpha [Sphingosinicella soli]|uniref:Pyruvate dehydrogenase E1 component alpha subunit n=1 Tax=Sphingosinicella soli TaxID=333708 RepID=A0A7W7B142_9SPHN|nr:thiamine pyrophosphate-dependent dehydrogenase E1 component subunit alpha [Sphingosinicella soli]MBB4631949.1 pyruvate dehydrogenase E1 component alpha subunit [Sphingosinicella soli]